MLDRHQIRTAQQARLGVLAALDDAMVTWTAPSDLGDIDARPRIRTAREVFELAGFHGDLGR